MAKEKSKQAEELETEAEMDLIPMIDVAMQFIIFMMVITEVSDNTKDKLTLPTAQASAPDRAEQGRIMFNITKTGQVRVRNNTFELADLDPILQEESRLSFDPKEDAPTRAIIIRVDEGAQFQHVAAFMRICMKHRLWKLMFATKPIMVN